MSATPEWLALLARRVAQLDGSKAAVANELGVSRSTVSLALAGRYPGSTAKLAARVISVYRIGPSMPTPSVPAPMPLLSISPDMPEWLALLAQRVEQLGSKAAAGEELGVSRSAVSLALAGKYPGGTERLAAKVLARYRICACPYLHHEIIADECRRHRTRPMPQSIPDELRFWQACRSCPVGAVMARSEAIAAGVRP